MNILKLKPQFNILITDTLSVFDENRVHTLPLEYSNILTRLVNGVSVDELSDADFEQIQMLSDSKFVSLSETNTSAIWEMCGISTNSLEQQKQHLRIKVVDKTYNKIGNFVSSSLLRNGIKIVEDTPTITLLFVDSIFQVENEPTPYLPIVCNRLKIWIGPSMFDWSVDSISNIKANKFYVDKVRYVLPEVFNDLQKTMISMFLMNMFMSINTNTISSICCIDLKTLSIKSFPL